MYSLSQPLPVARMRRHWQSLTAQLQRFARLMQLRRELMQMDRDETRATAEIAWLRDELMRHEANLRGLSALYDKRRFIIRAELHALRRSPCNHAHDLNPQTNHS